MEGESSLKKAGTFGLGLVILIAIFLTPLLFLRGMVWASEKALPWLTDAEDIAFAICVFGLLPLCSLRRTRPWAGVGFYVASFLFGAVLFAFSCVVVVRIWGYAGLIVGLLLGGLGVIPAALLATLSHALWPLFGNVVFGIALTFGTRFLGVFLLK